MATVFQVTVRDTYCGIKGEFAEEQTVSTKAEAQSWLKQFKKEYPSDCGYKVKMTEISAAQSMSQTA